MGQFKKTTIGFLIVLVSFFGVFGYIKPAKAIPTEVVADAPRLTENILDQVKTSLKVAVLNGVVQTVSYFTRKVAYDTAVWLAAGGKGESSLVFKDGWGSYLKKTADSAAGKALDAFGQEFGLNLCKIPDLRIDLALQMGLRLNFGAAAIEEPTCTFSEFRNTWTAENIRSRFGADVSVDAAFNTSYSAGQTDLGVYLAASNKIEAMINDQKQAAWLERLEGQGTKALTQAVSGQVLTPSQVVSAQLQNLSPAARQEMDAKQFSSILGTGLYQVIPSTLSTFVNTFLGETMRNFLSKGMFPWSEEGENGLAAGSYTATGRVSGRRAAEKMFSEMLLPNFSEVERYNILAQFGACPDSAGKDNCVIDEGFMQAAQEARYGKPITIAEAIEKNWLHGDWKLVPPSNQVDNTSKNCYQSAYCYSNIKKLRVARVLPLGFEIAAKSSNVDKPWSLKQVVDGFNDCTLDANGNVVYDPENKPFCRLIDPNWVLKVPLTRCNAVGYSNTLLTDVAPERIEDCVDTVTCVGSDTDGNCISYGYCVRESNVWQIDGDKCDAQFRTCVSYTDSENQTKSYLKRTLDVGFCEEKTVGCVAYSLSKDADGNWLPYASTQNDIINEGQNSIIFFNNQISSNCSADSAGCSAFKVATSSLPTGQTRDVLLNLKKAPYYLGCYDSDPNTDGIQWPKNKADLNRIQSAEDCDNYAQVCIPEEVNCAWYAPVNTPQDRVPGKFEPAALVDNQIVWNDQCDARCVGYDTYKEMPSNYSKGEDLAYIIPGSGKSCSSLEVGCSSFTNLSASGGGLEQVEYYSYLRPCISPDETKQKTFYTYEGSAYRGYELKVFVLEKDQNGAPRYFYRTSQDLDEFNNVCNESLYKAGVADPDCREFNDEAGNIYYRLLSKTIAVDQNCAPYRLNASEFYADGRITNQGACDNAGGYWDGSQCNLCFQNGEFRDGYCFYEGLPSQASNPAGSSVSCSAEMNTCRAYKGNTGNNIRTVFFNRFEEPVPEESLDGWSGITAGVGVFLSSESTHVGEHSVGYESASAGGGVVKNELGLTPGNSYSLSFWAKSNTDKSITISFDNGEIFSFGAARVNSDWNRYEIGPVELKGSATSTNLVFQFVSGEFDGNDVLFLDNVQLTELTDLVYLVKNTLSVDPVCDADPNDNLPGLALGCLAYKNDNNDTINLTGFSSLCREEAIGCTAVLDTYNTVTNPRSEIRNIWIEGPPNANVTMSIGDDIYGCHVEKGQTGCYIDVEGYEITQAGPRNVVASTVYIPADTPGDKPIYLVADKGHSCNAVDLGCMMAGREKDTPTGKVYEDVLIKNNPDNYDNILCSEEGVGCMAYTSDQGEFYFKDPEASGQKICVYRDDVSKGGLTYKGWFWKGVGLCDGVEENYCMIDADCVGGETCRGIDQQPCYPDFLREGLEYDIWSYGTVDKYKGFAGECPEEQNGCTEFVDHNDNDRAYYVLNNGKVADAKKECDGQVSEKGGCVLFDQTDNPFKQWNTEASYNLSNSKGGELVAPLRTEDSDANTVMKVIRDRECGEWLQCRSSHPAWDTNDSKWKEVCDDIGRCAEVSKSVEEQDKINCAKWVDDEHDVSNKILTEDLYVKRDISWTGMEFSGYSILGLYPIEELEQVNFGTFKDQDWRLAKKIPCAGVNCYEATASESPACAVSSDPCGVGGSGVCVNGMCVINIYGEGGVKIQETSPIQTCRAYPESDSPFPNIDLTLRSKSFDGANFCNELNNGDYDLLEGDAYGCECSYTKVNYGDQITKYWNYYNPNEPASLSDGKKGAVAGICSNDSNKSCDPDDPNSGNEDSACGLLGTCLRKERESKIIGWPGYCLEEDYSKVLYADKNQHPCLAWYPVDYAKGALDIYSAPEAGYQPSDKGKYYCLEAKGNYGENSETYNDWYDWTDCSQVHHLGLPICNGQLESASYRTNFYPFGVVEEDEAHLESDPFFPPYKGWGGSLYKKIYTPSKDKYFKDIDNVEINLDHQANEGDVVQKFFIRNGARGGDDYVFKNNYKVTDYNTGVKTYYGKEFGGCKVVLFAENNNSTYRDASDNFIELEECETGEASVKGGGLAASKVAEKIIDGQNKIVMRFMADDRDEADVPYVTTEESGVDDDYGFFPEYGDYVGGERDLADVVQGFVAEEALCNEGGGKHDSFEVILVFGAEPERKLEKIGVAACTADADDGEHYRFSLSANLREYCTVVADTAGSGANQNVAWTDRLWSGGNYTHPVTFYDYDLIETPFGSLDITQAPDDWIWLYSPRQIVTHNGAPYSCQGQCGGEKGADDLLDFTVKPSGFDISGANFADTLGALFAKTNAVYLLNDLYLYDEGKEADNYDLTATLTGAENAPKILALGDPGYEDRWLEGSFGFQINDAKNNEDYALFGSPARVNIKFYAYADPNQMPMRSISVDWGDGQQQALSGYYRNRRGLTNGVCQFGEFGGAGTCYVNNKFFNGVAYTESYNTNKPCANDTDCGMMDMCYPESEAPNFGSIEGVSCDNAYYRFDHVYYCVAGGSNFVSQCPNNRFSSGCCVFEPRVQVIDNWGWCNGDGASGFYGNDCFNRGWQTAGTIYVEPKE